MNRITITTSTELRKDKKTELVQTLEKKYGDANYVFHVDYELLGGIMIFDGETIYDGSVRTQLKKFREKIK